MFYFPTHFYHNILLVRARRVSGLIWPSSVVSQLLTVMKTSHYLHKYLEVFKKTIKIVFKYMLKNLSILITILMF
jgi:hypothetical protein